MAATVRTDGNDGQFVAVGQPKRIGPNRLAQLDDAPDHEGHDRFYAVARIDGVQMRDPSDPLTFDDACHVFYLDAAGERAVERRYVVPASEWDGIRATIQVAPDSDAIGEPWAAVRERYAAVLEYHDLDGAAEEDSA